MVYGECPEFLVLSFLFFLFISQTFNLTLVARLPPRRNGVWHLFVVDVSRRMTLTDRSACVFILTLNSRHAVLPSCHLSKLSWSEMSSGASCRMVALGDTDLLEWRRLSPASSSYPTPSKRLGQGVLNSREAFQGLRVRNGVPLPPAGRTGRY